MEAQSFVLCALIPLRIYLVETFADLILVRRSVIVLFGIV